MIFTEVESGSKRWDKFLELYNAQAVGQPVNFEAITILDLDQPGVAVSLAGETIPFSAEEVANIINMLEQEAQRNPGHDARTLIMVAHWFREALFAAVGIGGHA